MERERTFGKEIASLDAVFDFLDEFYAAEGIGGRTPFSLSLVVEELFTNLVKYNRSGNNPITLRIGRHGDEARLELVDRDVDPFDPTTVPVPDLDAPMSHRKPGGLGLHLVRAIADRISFEYQNRVMKIVVVKKLERGDA